MKKVSLLLVLAFCCGFVCAQKFRKSYKDDFMTSLLETIPDSLKADMQALETPVIHYIPSQGNIDEVKKLRQSQKNVTELMGFVSKEVYISIWEKSIPNQKLQSGFDFWYLDEQGKMKCFQTKDNYGKFSRSFRTKTGLVYEFDYCWGFLTIKENKMTILSCCCEIKNSQSGGGDYLSITPFDGTNVLYWTIPIDGGRIPLF